MTQQESAVCVYDFTLSEEKWNLGRENLKVLLGDHCKKWVFQLEEGAGTGFRHYQGRVSLKVRERMPGVLKMFGDGNSGWRWSVTSSANRDNMFYVIKSDTRVEGPWKDDDAEPKQKPVKLERMELRGPRPWQKALMEIANTPMPRAEDDSNDAERCINFIHDPVGGIGKSTFAAWLRYYKDAMNIPNFDRAEDIMAWVASGAKNPRTHMFVDLPRAMDQLKLRPLYSAIEMLKEGQAFDKRYFRKEVNFGYPHVFVFGNTIPDPTMLSGDRWKFWKVVDNELVAFDPIREGLGLPTKIKVGGKGKKRAIEDVDE
nr:MAG: replication associated protein [Cressdnaviricota sp.]